MEIKTSRRLQSLPEYAFKVIDDKVQELRAQGARPIDFGVGDPSTPTPELVRRSCQVAIDERATSGYPSYIGAAEFREAVASWTKRRFGCELDPATEICATVGSKEAVFHFPEAFLDPGDVVLVPSPGYPPYSRGTTFAEGKSWFYPLQAENGFLPDLDAIPEDIARAARLMWVNYPNSPTGAVADLADFERLYAWTRQHNIILCSDEAYTELWYGQTPPHSALEVAKEGVVAFHSLSKTSAMTCYRVGWIAGDKRIIAAYRKLKTNIDSGTPTFIQDAAITALEDDGHKAAMRSEYDEKRVLLTAALVKAGLPPCDSQGSLFLWQRAPAGMTGLELTERLLRPAVAIVTIPGVVLAEPLQDGRNPGQSYVRFSLTAPLADVREAAERLQVLAL